MPVDDMEKGQIRTKQQLHAALEAAAVLEQQFMCQYLYAVLSLKKECDARCQAYQLELVRRWASTVYMVARQEMEHLSLVNSLLTATGGVPVFSHHNFPTIIEWAKGPEALVAAPATPPCVLPFVLEKFSLNTVRRFTCMEAPHLRHVPEAERRDLEHWCYQDASGDCGCVEATSAQTKVPRQSLIDTTTITIGGIEDLYREIRLGLIWLSSQSEAQLFDGHDSGQSEVPSEYDIYLFPIMDLESALAAVDTITRQGEGIDGPPGFESHYKKFYAIAKEYEAELSRDPDFEPARDLPDNPRASDYPEGSLARLAVGVFEDGYATLLFMLTGYFQTYSGESWTEPPYLSQALEQTSFAPLMTMFIRSLAEIITELPGTGGKPAGPSFQLSKKDRELLLEPTNRIYTDMDFYVRRVETLVKGLKALHEHDALPRALKPKLEFMVQTNTRIVGNLRYVYENGTFPNFNPSAS
jgi:hypothetical protein